MWSFTKLSTFRCSKLVRSSHIYTMWVFFLNGYLKQLLFTAIPLPMQMNIQPTDKPQATLDSIQQLKLKPHKKCISRPKVCMTNANKWEQTRRDTHLVWSIFTFLFSCDRHTHSYIPSCTMSWISYSTLLWNTIYKQQLYTTMFRKCWQECVTFIYAPSLPIKLWILLEVKGWR